MGGRKSRFERKRNSQKINIFNVSLSLVKIRRQVVDNAEKSR